MRDTFNDESVKIIDNIKDADSWWGRVDYILTPDDIKALEEGKIINASCNCEYAITLRLEMKEGD